MAPATQESRYEFRCWPGQERAGAIAARLRAEAGDEAAGERRQDIYLLPMPAGRHGDTFLAKLREGHHLQIKVRSAHPPPLQLWRMGHEAGFPLTGSDCAALKEALGETALTMSLARAGATGSPEALCATLAGGSVRPVAVDKQRQLFRRANTRMEVTQIWLSGTEVWSLALEDPDLHGAIAAIEDLALQGWRNLHYGAALRLLLAGAPLPGPEAGG